MASKSSKLPLSLKIPLALLAATVLTIIAGNLLDLAAYNKAVARAQKLGLATDPSIFTSDVPDDQNAALYPGADFKTRVDYTSPTNLPLPWSKTDLAKAKSDLALHFSQMGIVAKASLRPKWFAPRDYTHPTLTLLPELANLKAYVRLFTSRGLIEWQSGDRKAATEDLLVAARLTNFLRHEFALIGPLVHIAAKAIVRSAVARIVVFSDATPESVQLQQSVESTLQNPDFHHMLSTELAMELDGAVMLEQSPETLAQAVSGTPAVDIPPHLPTNISRLKAMVITHICNLDEAVLSHPGDPALAYKASLAVKPPRAFEYSGEQVMFNILQPYYPNAFRAAFADPVRGQVFTIGTQILAYKRDHGSLPGTLADLPKGLDITDPFTGKPLLYKIEGNKFVVWSTGADAVDDTHGVVPTSSTSPQDIMFQTVDPSRNHILGH